MYQSSSFNYQFMDNIVSFIHHTFLPPLATLDYSETAPDSILSHL